jgi:hypothetical protein
MLASIRTLITVRRIIGGALGDSVDGLRPAAGAKSSSHRARRSAPDGRTVRMCAKAAMFANSIRI